MTINNACFDTRNRITFCASRGNIPHYRWKFMYRVKFFTCHSVNEYNKYSWYSERFHSRGRWEGRNEGNKLSKVGSDFQKETTFAYIFTVSQRMRLFSFYSTSEYSINNEFRTFTERGFLLNNVPYRVLCMWLFLSSERCGKTFLEYSERQRWTRTLRYIRAYDNRYYNSIII